MAPFTYLSLLAAALLAVAIPTGERAPTSVPDLIPGPGLPSLGSLNVTTTDLQRRDFDFGTSALDLVARDKDCMDDTFLTDRNRAIDCYNYFMSIPDAACATGGFNSATSWCQYGDTIVAGLSSGAGPESSACKDVAITLRDIILGCTRASAPDLIKGKDFVNGNGMLQVIVANNGFPFGGIIHA